MASRVRADVPVSYLLARGPAAGWQRSLRPRRCLHAEWVVDPGAWVAGGHYELAWMSPYAVFLALVVAAFVIGAASRSLGPWIVPTGMVVYWVIATIRLAAEGDNGTGEDQTGLAVFVGVLAVSVLAASTGAGRLLRFWLDDRW